MASSREIEKACRANLILMTLSGGAATYRCNASREWGGKCKDFQ